MSHRFTNLLHLPTNQLANQPIYQSPVHQSTSPQFTGFREPQVQGGTENFRWTRTLKPQPDPFTSPRIPNCNVRSPEGGASHESRLTFYVSRFPPPAVAVHRAMFGLVAFTAGLT
jgi:hypothetical protein